MYICTLVLVVLVVSTREVVSHVSTSPTRVGVPHDTGVPTRVGVMIVGLAPTRGWTAILACHFGMPFWHAILAAYALGGIVWTREGVRTRVVVSPFRVMLVV